MLPVVLVNSDLADILGVVVLSSIPLGPSLVRALRVLFRLISEPCGVAMGNPGLAPSARGSAALCQTAEAHSGGSTPVGLAVRGLVGGNIHLVVPFATFLPCGREFPTTMTGPKPETGVGFTAVPSTWTLSAAELAAKSVHTTIWRCRANALHRCRRVLPCLRLARYCFVARGIGTSLQARRSLLGCSFLR